MTYFTPLHLGLPKQCGFPYLLKEILASIHPPLGCSCGEEWDILERIQHQGSLMDVYEQKSASNLNTFYHMASNGKITVIGIRAGSERKPIPAPLATRCPCGKRVRLRLVYGLCLVCMKRSRQCYIEEIPCSDMESFNNPKYNINV